MLVDFAIRARADGLDRSAALLLAAKVRLRPILMTTLAMIFGMVPLAFALTEGSEMRAPMGQAVIGGVITSTFLTLFVVPLFFAVMEKLTPKSMRIGKKKEGIRLSDDDDAEGESVAAAPKTEAALAPAQGEHS